jgi:hypothetical protein
MSCDILKGRERPCKNKLGGLKTLYLMNFVDPSFAVAGETGIVTGVLVTESFKFDLEGDLNNFESASESSRDNGTTFWTTTLNVTLKGIDSVTSGEFNKLVQGYPIAVVLDRNGMHHVIGIDDGIDFQITEQTGSAKGDLNGYVLVGTATTKYAPAKLISTQLTAFLETVDVPE